MTGSARPSLSPPSAEAHPLPPIVEAPAELARRLLLRALLAGLLLLAVAAGFVALVDPYGTLGVGLFPTATPGDPATKADLLDRLPAPPQVVVLGASRSMGVMPADVRRRTGLRTFNAGVRGGGIIDAWALSSFVGERFPAVHVRYVWLLDDAAFSETRAPLAVVQSSVLRGYLPADVRAATATPSRWRTLSLTGLEDALRVVQARLEGRRPERFRADGSWRYAGLGERLTQMPGRTHRARVDASHAYVQGWLASRPTFTPLSRRFFARTLDAIARRGDHALLVFPPLEPGLRRAIGPLGWSARHRAVRAFALAVARRDGVRVLDLSNPASIGARAADFRDGTHLDQAGLRKLVAALVRRTHGALQ